MDFRSLKTGTRVVVGVSGGVDSSVTALLLKEHGLDVQAIHMTNWDADDEYCSAAEDLQDARDVCRILDIPLHHVNFADEYRQQVFTQFLSDYEAGRTPNPDVLCNREIKFGSFLDHARRLGGDWIATGHYAQVSHDGGRSKLRLAKDAHKDQTYFLHAVKQKALQKVLFPLGDLPKPEVRAIANAHGLPTREKKDSTGICFIGERPFQEFLSRFLKAEQGPIMTLDGRQIGQHNGAVYFTIGQRKGLGIGGVRGASDQAWYVVGRSVEQNTVFAAQGDDHPALWGRNLLASQPNWIAGHSPFDAVGNSLSLTARIRHGQQPAACQVQAQPDKLLTVRFDTDQWAIAEGQYIVFYRDNTCLGGATIERAGQAEQQAEPRIA
ncbi:MAG: tRNA 2-thiouridine(34) synthase MnmA [Pseudomonadota bacterium]